jgi:hypothetical protein
MPAGSSLTGGLVLEGGGLEGWPPTCSTRACLLRDFTQDESHAENQRVDLGALAVEASLV